MDSPTLQYNLGLAYLDVKQYDEALSHAHRAYEMGVTLPGLRNRLKAAGQWREPAPATADAAKDAAQVRDDCAAAIDRVEPRAARRPGRAELLVGAAPAHAQMAIRVGPGQPVATIDEAARRVVLFTVEIEAAMTRATSRSGTSRA